MYFRYRNQEFLSSRLEPLFAKRLPSLSEALLQFFAVCLFLPCRKFTIKYIGAHKIPLFVAVNYTLFHALLSRDQIVRVLIFYPKNNANYKISRHCSRNNHTGLDLFFYIYSMNKIEHIGIAVKDLEAANQVYAALLRSCSLQN